MKKILFIMKKINYFIFLFIISMMLFSTTVKVKAITPLDRIDYYEIKIDPRDDGTLDMHFNIVWTVLDSKTEGPLKWIKIGIPNYHVDEIRSISDNIKNIKYYSDSGSYIRIDFNKKYYKGEQLNIEFSIHQSRMYNLEDEYCYYNYKPGWFGEIIVTKAVVLWNNKNVIDSNNMDVIDGYLKWEAKLYFEETIDINVFYNQSSFINLSKDKQYTSAYTTPQEKIIIFSILTIIVIVVIILYVVYRKTQDPYLYERGFCGRRYYHNNLWYHYIYRPRRYRSNGYNSKGVKIVNPTPNPNQGSTGGSSHGCACACACACAGGGRAGCSKKEFYKK